MESDSSRETVLPEAPAHGLKRSSTTPSSLLNAQATSFDPSSRLSGESRPSAQRYVPHTSDKVAVMTMALEPRTMAPGPCTIQDSVISPAGSQVPAVALFLNQAPSVAGTPTADRNLSHRRFVIDASLYKRMIITLRALRQLFSPQYSGSNHPTDLIIRNKRFSELSKLQTKECLQTGKALQARDSSAGMVSMLATYLTCLIWCHQHRVRAKVKRPTTAGRVDDQGG